MFRCRRSRNQCGDRQWYGKSRNYMYQRLKTGCNGYPAQQSKGRFPAFWNTPRANFQVEKFSLGEVKVGAG